MNKLLWVTAVLFLTHGNVNAKDCSYLGTAEDPLNSDMLTFLNGRPDRLFDADPSFSFQFAGNGGGAYIFLAGTKKLSEAPTDYGVFAGLGVCNKNLGKYVPISGLFRNTKEITYDELLPLGSCQGQEEEFKRQVITQVQMQIDSSQKTAKATVQDFGILWPVSLFFQDFVGLAYGGVTVSEDGAERYIFFGNGLCAQGTLQLGDFFFVPVQRPK
ncbi:MAG: hypothetical protein AABZ55_11720 [Bdellovibrionota bacterium]